MHETIDFITIGIRVEGNRQNSYAFQDRPVEEGAFGNFSLQILQAGMKVQARGVATGPYTLSKQLANTAQETKDLIT